MNIIYREDLLFIEFQSILAARWPGSFALIQRTKMGPKWDQNGTKVGTKWDQSVTKWDLNQNGAKMGQK